MQLKSLLRALNHPSDEFSELKYNRNWSLSTATVILLVWFFAEVCQKRLTGFRFNYNNPEKFNTSYVLLSTIVLFILWSVINWAVASLLEGKGKMIEIFVSCAYSLVPYIVCTLAGVVISHFLTKDETAFLTIMQYIGWIGSGFMLISAIKTVHEYTFWKTFFSIFLTIAGMVFVLFLAVLFFGLIQQVILFFRTIYVELTLRS